MRRWRAKRGTTRFDRIVGRKLKALLEECEQAELGSTQRGSPLENIHLTTLRDTLATNDVFGFPINLTFTDIEAASVQRNNETIL